MFFKTLINLQSYLAFCLLLFNQQVVGKVESSRPNGNRFEDLSEDRKTAAEQLNSLHQKFKDIKEMPKNTAQNKTVVKANPDNVTIGGGLAVTSWLLYQSIDLGKIERFFDEIEELKGQFKEYSRLKMPELEGLYRSAREYTDFVETKKQLAYLNEVHQELKKYYGKMQEFIDKSDEFSKDVNNGKQDADIKTAISGLIALLGGAALLVGGPEAVPPVIWKAGVVSMMMWSTASSTKSLKNANDLAKASERLTTQKHELKQWREIERDMERMVEMTMEIIRLVKERSLTPPMDPLIYENPEKNHFWWLVWVCLAILCATPLIWSIYSCLKRGESHQARRSEVTVYMGVRVLPPLCPFYRSIDYLDWFEIRKRKQLDF